MKAVGADVPGVRRVGEGTVVLEIERAVLRLIGGQGRILAPGKHVVAQDSRGQDAQRAGIVQGVGVRGGGQRAVDIQGYRGLRRAARAVMDLVDELVGAEKAGLRRVRKSAVRVEGERSVSRAGEPVCRERFAVGILVIGQQRLPRSRRESRVRRDLVDVVGRLGSHAAGVGRRDAADGRGSAGRQARDRIDLRRGVLPEEGHDVRQRRIAR